MNVPCPLQNGLHGRVLSTCAADKLSRAGRNKGDREGLSDTLIEVGAINACFRRDTEVMLAVLNEIGLKPE